MWPRRYFAGRMFAPRYWSQSTGTVVTSTYVTRLRLGARGHRFSITPGSATDIGQ